MGEDGVCKLIYTYIHHIIKQRLTCTDSGMCYRESAIDNCSTHSLILQVVTVFLGLLKLSYTHWRVRKYTALEKLARRVSIVREKSIIRSLSTRRKGDPKRQNSSRYKPQERTGPDVPFGIKALESGVEVEGVWDSRPNSRRSSFAHGQNSRNSHVIDMGMVEAGLLSEDSKGSLMASTTASHQFEKSVSADRLASEPPSPDMHPAVANRKYPPHAFMRYEGIQGHRTVNTFSTLASDTLVHSGKCSHIVCLTPSDQHRFTKNV